MTLQTDDHRFMEFTERYLRSYWMTKVANFAAIILWNILHILVTIYCWVDSMVHILESYLITYGVLKKYKSLDASKLRYLAIVVDSEEAYQTSEVIELLHWLTAIGVKHVCLYDMEGVLKDSQQTIISKCNARPWKYKDYKEDKPKFTEPLLDEALRIVGCSGPEPDLLLIYGTARCHLGFPAWRMRYTEIVHMGRLKCKKYGSLIKAIYRFTTIRQNYGK
ncbi:uncharacterized protein LOC104904378 isoform X4 [Beta vulgaris subsp. vulgaris]|uniref:uncharacterized protein LOC104904378 isoform X4 n=1 Tax=Beta vulgaris subsp. vulgaris TaxID=3555 RepID=UPI0020372E1A|nr:uncharacterized protein LOC104904378 isoform X4 [Beta vulgaris subsp. vulgaris]